MSDQLVVYTAAAITLIGLMAYVIFAGADFGGGVWDLFAWDKRRQAQREAIARAMGPVWEANHVWLVFVLVMLFTCFPRAYAALSIVLFIPFHLALLGIMLRGAAFVFRGYARIGIVWSAVFGASSIITPFLLGAAFGAVTAGPADKPAGVIVWLQPYAICTGLLAVSTCAFLAGVYLSFEVTGELREAFRRRAIVAGTATAALAIITLYFAHREAPWFFGQLIGRRTWPILAAGIVLFASSAIAVFDRHYRLGRWCAAGEIICLLLGWGIAQAPYLAHPDYTLMNSAAPLTTIRFLLLALPVGAVLLAPSLWLLFRVFKTPVAAQ